MRHQTLIKPGSLVLIKRVAVIEILVTLILFAISFITNYEQLFHRLPLIGSMRYDIFILFAASLLQLVITISVFCRWYAENYELRDQELLHRRGLFFVKQNSLWLKDAQAVEYARGPMEKLLGLGTIVIYNNVYKRPVYLRSLENGETYLAMIRNAVDQAKTKRLGQPKPDIVAMIKRGENSRLEFKQTFRWDVREHRANKNLEKAIMKTVAGFLNAGGGQLVVGVTDDGVVTGLEKDYKTLVRQDRDGLENHFTLAFKNILGVEFRQFVNLEFEKVGKREVCLVIVEQSDKPVYLKDGKGEEFYIRTGNTTTPLSMSEARSYIEGHWK
ncbi:MAG: putative DNA binding domain-containing protein [Patescibacteria group bacterium]|nr:putative DNA binding domain-containing protein [Patescibacteria group bacterium]